MGQGFLRTRREIDAVSKSKQPGGEKKDGEDAEEMPHADAAGLHGCDFAVGGETAQADQYANQHSGGQGYGQRFRDDQDEQFDCAGKWRAVANYKFQNLDQLFGVDDKRENRGTDQRMGRDFTENVASENAHDTDKGSLALDRMIRDVAIRIKKLLRKVRKGRKSEDRITERFDRQMVSIRSSCPQARVTTGRSSNGARFLKTVCSGAPKALQSCRQYGE